MMFPDSKSKFVFWLLIFLVVLNISLFVTLILLFSKSADAPSPASGEHLKNSFSKSLSLTPAQDEKVKIILEEYKILTDPIIADIRNHRMQIVEEAAKGTPDKTLLEKYEEEISLLQKQMQNASVNQYLALKEICTPVQCERLSALYRELYGNDGSESGQGPRHRHRGGRGE
jgi:Spy/CpxP family protein refolding chaperone